MLQLWQAASEYSYHSDKWQWGGRYEANSIGDAEQLLCLMYPAAEISELKLDQPDQTSKDVLHSLMALGDAVEVPKLLVRIVQEYMDRYLTDAGTPIFAGGSYFQPRDQTDSLTREQRDLSVVDSFSMSITLSLATLGFLKVFGGVVKRKQLRDELDALEAAASRRLSAAMVGLLRSFTVNSFSADSPEGLALCRTANQTRLPHSQIVDDLQRELLEVRAGLLDVTLGSGGASALDNDHHLFECGWSWGVIKDAPLVVTSFPLEQEEGVAQARPFLYFTVVALDGISDLFSERTRVLGLLNEEQQGWMRALQLRWDLTQQYWRTIASFGSGRWPLEDIPWRTTDGRESDYYSVLVSSVMAEALARQPAAEAELARVGHVLDELASRGRLTRRPLEEDLAVDMHLPGVQLSLYGAEDLGPDMILPVADFATAVLKRTLRVAGLAQTAEMRDRFLDLSDTIWDHVDHRRLKHGPAVGLWDDVTGTFPSIVQEEDRPSWYLTQRVAECLVLASKIIRTDPLRSSRILDDALELLNEADHLFSQEMLAGAPASGQTMRASLERLDARLIRARKVVTTKPGTAMSIAMEVLRELDDLVAARQDVSRVH